MIIQGDMVERDGTRILGWSGKESRQSQYLNKKKKPRREEELSGGRAFWEEEQVKVLRYWLLKLNTGPPKDQAGYVMLV